MVRAHFLWWTACGLAVLSLGCGEGGTGGPFTTPDNSASGEVAYEFDAGAGRPAPGVPAGLGRGPGQGGDRFDLIVENDFLHVQDKPLSTFSIDVDTASYAKIRQYLMQYNALPPADAVRIEELVNYFDYDYPPPIDAHPFAVHVDAACCPWREEHRLVRVGLQGRELSEDQPPKNLVFLIDVSGSMNGRNKLNLVKQGLRMLVERLEAGDRVAVVVYAGAAGLALPATSGDAKSLIHAALDRLHAGGSTNGGEGIQLAYRTALENFVPGGVNRVVLCTDGDFNVGVTGTGDLVRLAEQYAREGVYLSVLGFGTGNLNDAMLEQLSNRANGNYAFIDNPSEAYKVLVQELGGTLVTIAKDVKIQVEFNPDQVAAYRLIGYENRRLAARDFNDDRKDAGEIGAGHSVTALYELVLTGQESEALPPPVDALKYQTESTDAPQQSDEWLTVKLRYKLPDEDQSTALSVPLSGSDAGVDVMPDDFRFAAAVSLFGMILRESAYANDAGLQAVDELARTARGPDPHGYRIEFLRLVRHAAAIKGQPIVDEALRIGSAAETGMGSPRVRTTTWSVVPHSEAAVFWDRVVLISIGAGLGICLTAGAAGLCLWLVFRVSPRWETHCPGAPRHAPPRRVGIPPGRPVADRWEYGDRRAPEKQTAM